jgi:hypothetical protein
VETAAEGGLGLFGLVYPAESAFRAPSSTPSTALVFVAMADSWAPRRLRFGAGEAEAVQIELPHEGIEDANRIVIVDKVLKRFRKQADLRPADAFNEPGHRDPLESMQENPSRQAAFPHSQGQNRKSRNGR